MKRFVSCEYPFARGKTRKKSTVKVNGHDKNCNCTPLSVQYIIILGGITLGSHIEWGGGGGGFLKFLMG